MKLFCTSVYTIFGGNAAYLYVIKNEDISTHIAPTIDLSVDNFRTFGLTTVKYIADVVAIAKRYGETPNALPPLYSLGRWAFKRWLEKLVVEGLAARAIFESYLCYEIQLWQLSIHEFNRNDPRNKHPRLATSFLSLPIY
ncbi:hypothetical protein [Nostoc sp. 'Peltigera malacea cyanobiont' DB3992]|uniref:hypothetical protein n=1 Tax=Nostoc sp. 'Peltigera malacea cyanobiont' DB3992 TaxID=1206980 RepID=UPI00211DE968|nr:hypothetical protein [Nostoc sp. 'Peltigera malacea cyanobiont' DB3992]